MPDDKEKTREEKDMSSIREEESAVGHLAALLSNGVEVALGENFPAGWEDSRNGKTRRYIPAKEEHLTAARRLLGWDRPKDPDQK